MRTDTTQDLPALNIAMQASCLRTRLILRKTVVGKFGISLIELRTTGPWFMVYSVFLVSRGLGLLTSYLERYPMGMEPTPLEFLMQTLTFSLASLSGVQRISAALLMSEWARSEQVRPLSPRSDRFGPAVESPVVSHCTRFVRQDCKCPEYIVQRLNAILSEQIVYEEIAVLNTRLQTDCQVRRLGMARGRMVPRLLVVYRRPHKKGRSTNHGNPRGILASRIRPTDRLFANYLSVFRRS